MRNRQVGEKWNARLRKLSCPCDQWRLCHGSDGVRGSIAEVSGGNQTQVWVVRRELTIGDISRPRLVKQIFALARDAKRLPSLDWNALVYHQKKTGEDFMNSSKPLEQNSFVWNAGGWFGSQIGGTVWMLFGGLSLLFSDLFSGLVCLGGFAVVNVMGCYLWQRREKMDPYVGIQQLLFTLAVVCPSISVVLYCRGILTSRESILLIMIAPALTTFLAFQNWAVKQSRGPRFDGNRSSKDFCDENE